MLIASEAPGGRGQNARLDCITVELCSAPDLVLCVCVCVCNILHQQSSDIAAHWHKSVHTPTHTNTHKHTHPNTHKLTRIHTHTHTVWSEVHTQPIQSIGHDAAWGLRLSASIVLWYTHQRAPPYHHNNQCLRVVDEHTNSRHVTWHAILLIFNKRIMTCFSLHFDELKLKVQNKFAPMMGLGWTQLQSAPYCAPRFYGRALVTK